MAVKITFSYRAVDIRGTEESGSMEADSQADLMMKLRNKGLTLVKCSATGSVTKKQEVIGSVKIKEILPFSHHLRTMYSAGVPILSGLEDLKQETTNPYFAKVLDNITLALKNGSSLSDAMAAYPQIFPKIYIAMTRVGEATGNLDMALDSVIAYLERREETKGRIISALIYPVVLSMAVFMLILILLFFLLPRITKIYTDAGVKPDKLPGPTRFIIAMKDFLGDNWMILLALGVLAFIGLIVCRKQPNLRVKTDEMLLRVPFFGSLMLKDAASSFCNTLASLQRSGVSVNESLKFCEDVIANSFIKKKISDLTRSIQEGERFPIALKKTGVFPSLVITMVKVGDESGKLDASLKQVCEFYDREIPAAIKRFMQISESAIIFGAGGIVLFIILATLMPIYQLVTLMKK